MLSFINLYYFLQTQYQLGTAKSIIYSFLSSQDKKDLKLGFYEDISTNGNLTSLYDLSLEKEYKKDISSFDEEDIETSKATYFVGIYKIQVGHNTFYLGEIYTDDNKYKRCDFLDFKVTTRKYLQDLYYEDNKIFPKDEDLIVYLT